MAAFVTDFLADVASHGTQVVTAVISGVITVSGALLGVVVANRNNRRLGEEDRAHENTTRFHNQRIQTYIDFLRRLDGFAAAVQAACATHDRAERYRLLASAMNATGEPYAALRIMASAEVCAAAQACMGKITEQHIQLVQEEDEDGQFLKLEDGTSENYLRLRDAIREELGITANLLVTPQKKPDTGPGFEST